MLRTSSSLFLFQASSLSLSILRPTLFLLYAKPPKGYLDQLPKRHNFSARQLASNHFEDQFGGVGDAVPRRNPLDLAASASGGGGGDGGGGDEAKSGAAAAETAAAMENSFTSSTVENDGVNEATYSKWFCQNYGIESRDHFEAVGAPSTSPSHKAHCDDSAVLDELEHSVPELVMKESFDKKIYREFFVDTLQADAEPEPVEPLVAEEEFHEEEEADPNAEKLTQ